MKAKTLPQPEPSIAITHGEAATIVEGIWLLKPIWTAPNMTWGVNIGVGGRPVDTHHRGSATIFIAEASAKVTSLMARHRFEGRPMV